MKDLSKNVKVKLDLNKKMPPETRSFGVIIISTISILILITYGFGIWIVSSGKNIKTPLYTISSPNLIMDNKSTKDSSLHDDHSTHINIGKMKGDVISGNKIVNNNNRNDTSSNDK